jgi:hypothetical protein
MRKYLLLILLLLPYLTQAQTPSQTVAPELAHVTVYLNGTALEHHARLTLPAGISRVLVTGLSYKLNEQRLEVALGEDAELLSVDQDTDTTPLTQTTPIHPTAVDSLTRTEQELHAAEDEILGLQQEKAFLLANQVLASGTQQNWSTELSKGAALMRTRLPIITREIARLQPRVQTLTAQANALRPRATEAGAGSKMQLLIRAPRPVTSSLTIRYYVNSRGPWSPKLDIRADAAGRELQFISHGLLRNQSGLAWNQVPVVLMRHALGEDVSRPNLTPWELDFDGGDHIGEGRVDEFVVKGTAKGKPVDVAQSTRYELPEKITLKNGSRRDITLPVVKLAGRPEYLAIPRLSEHVYLQAKVAGWEGLQLPDEAKVFHQGVYVGNTELNDRAYNDSLEVALGHDELLVVGRAKLEDFSSNAGLGDKRRVRLMYELNVRNRHPAPVRLRLLDQVPISEEKEIVVKVLQTDGAERDERTGKLTWGLVLAAGESKKVRFSFQVDYPKDKQVEIINHQVRISNPKFR